MTTYRLFIITLLVVCSLTATAQTKMSPNDSIMNRVRIKELSEKRTQLKKRISIEDAKRNQVVNGITPEVQETLNDKQDSICLDLRSRLVAVELELKELMPNKAIDYILNHQKDTK